MIEAGRCVVKQGDVSALDIADGEYELATAFETIYFWPGLENALLRSQGSLNPAVFL